MASLFRHEDAARYIRQDRARVHVHIRRASPEFDGIVFDDDLIFILQPPNGPTGFPRAFTRVGRGECGNEPLAYGGVKSRDGEVPRRPRIESVVEIIREGGRQFLRSRRRRAPFSLLEFEVPDHPRIEKRVAEWISTASESAIKSPWISLITPARPKGFHTTGPVLHPGSRADLHRPARRPPSVRGGAHGHRPIRRPIGRPRPAESTTARRINRDAVRRCRVRPPFGIPTTSPRWRAARMIGARVPGRPSPGGSDRPPEASTRSRPQGNPAKPRQRPTPGHLAGPFPSQRCEPPRRPNPPRIGCIGRGRCRT